MEDWFIHVIVIQYIVFFLASKINKRYLVTITIGADSILTVIYFCMNKPIGWFNALWLFAFGMFAAKYKEKIINIINKYYYQSLVVSFICFVLSGYVFALNKGAVWANVFKPVSGMFLCLCICIIMRKCRLNSPIVMWGGHRSLYLYIVHIAVWSLVRAGNAIVRLWVALLVTILVTEIIYKMITFVVNFCDKKNHLKS